MNFLKPRTKQLEMGATMVEAALIMGVLVFFVLGVIEVGRYFTIKSLLQRAAKSGLELAIRHDDLLFEGTSPEGIQKLAQAHAEIQNRIADNITGGGVKVFQGNSILGSIGGNAAEWPAIVLRPGESGYYMKSGTQIQIEHPTYENRTASDSMPSLLQSHPVLIEIDAAMPSIVPFLGTIPIRVQAIGMVEIPPVGIPGVPGQPDFIPPLCGNGIFEPDYEDCEYVGQQGVDIKHECKLNCKKQPKCGNRILNPEAGEECDRADPANTGGNSCQDVAANNLTKRKWCNSQCRIYELPKCGDNCLSPGEPCEVRWDTERNRTSAGLPSGYVCAKRSDTECIAHPLPQCDGLLIEITCPPNLIDQLRCFSCSGEGGNCAGKVVERSSPCHPESTSSLAGTKLCDGCHQVIDLCNDGILGNSQGTYVEECEPGLGLVTDPFGAPIPDGKYCSQQCKVEDLCGNGRVDSGEACDGSAEPFQWEGATDASGAACDRFCTCVDCRIQRPDCLDPNVTRCPANTRPTIIPGSDPVMCNCCPTTEGGVDCVDPLP